MSNIVRVSKGSNPRLLAAALIDKTLTSKQSVVVQAIGVEAIGRAAIGMAELALLRGHNQFIKMYFVDVPDDEVDKPPKRAVRFEIVT